MTYKDTLKPWAVARLIPPVRWVIIGRYRHRSDAEGHLRLLRRRIPNVKFLVVFDLPRTKVESTDKLSRGSSH
ncbi:MAG: hypothetical protein WA919_02935 [Coleofasciculaceae cyanobacterium]